MINSMEYTERIENLLEMTPSFIKSLDFILRPRVFLNLEEFPNGEFLQQIFVLKIWLHLTVGSRLLSNRRCFIREDWTTLK